MGKMCARGSIPAELALTRWTRQRNSMRVESEGPVTVSRVAGGIEVCRRTKREIRPDSVVRLRRASYDREEASPRTIRTLALYPLSSEKGEWASSLARENQRREQFTR